MISSLLEFLCLAFYKNLVPHQLLIRKSCAGKRFCEYSSGKEYCEKKNAVYECKTCPKDNCNGRAGKPCGDWGINFVIGGCKNLWKIKKKKQKLAKARPKL